MLNRFFQIFVFTIIAIYTIGCNVNRMTLDVASDITKDDFTMQDIPVCKTGDILMVGQKCMDEGTDAIFEILDNGNVSYTSKSGLFYEATDVLDATGSTLNDQTYNFIARKQAEGTWQIERVSSDLVR